MAGNAKPRGAVRKSKKGPTTGSGGNNKRRLEGKGPTPKAEDRPYHAAAKRKKVAERTSAKSPAAAKKTGAAPRKYAKADGLRGEIVAGRNAVLEALRESVPATELLVARSIDVDDRVAESLCSLHSIMDFRFVKHTVPKLKESHLIARELFFQLSHINIHLLKKLRSAQRTQC